MGGFFVTVQPPEPVEGGANAYTDFDLGLAEVLFTGLSEEVRQSNISALQAKVAEIKKRPPNPEMIVAPTKSMAEVIAYWDAHPPTPDDIPPDEWDGLWANFEADIYLLSNRKTRCTRCC